MQNPPPKRPVFAFFIPFTLFEIHVKQGIKKKQSPFPKAAPIQ